MLWNEEEWKWKDLEEADMQINGVPDYVGTPNQENDNYSDNYYDNMQSSKLTKKKRERHTQNQR